MSRQRSRSLPQSSGPSVCCFCGFSEDNEIEYGKLLIQDGIVTHYYCLLLSSNMEQNGNDDEGILGFMHSDIQKELRRGKRLSCFYCKKIGATLGCCNTRCKRVFHLPCGLQAGSLHQFFGEFRSFCVRHRLKQQIDDHIKQEAAVAGTVTCYICYEEVNPQNAIRTLWAPCCRKNAWFHRKCVQHLALSAGYFFKCPLCNNKQEFQEAMLEHGIYIPHQDASWELVPNAFQELLHRHNRCDADNCLCPKGRTHTSVNAKWELVLCRLCGSQGIHKACGHLKWASSAWECADCIGMLKKSDKTSLPVISGVVKITNKIPEEDSSSDSEISVGGNPSPVPVRDLQDSPSSMTSPIKLRPGPKSFKLQQVGRNIQSMGSTTIGASNTSLATKVNISSYIGSESSTDSSLNEKRNDKLRQADSTNFFDSNALPKSIEVALGDFSEKTEISISLRSNASRESAQEKLGDPNCRIAEVIVIDSDDEVEIISEQPKQNVLTTIDGTKIEIHSLCQTAGESGKVQGDLEIDGPRHSEQSKSPHSTQSTKNDPMQSNKSSVIKTVSMPPTSSKTPKNKSNVLKLGVSGENVSAKKIVITEKVIKKKNYSNLISMNKDLKNEPTMNLKITNVTSLRLEDFANTSSQELDESKNVNSGTIITVENVQNGLFIQDHQQLQLVEIKNSEIRQKSHTNLFQLKNSTFKESNVKRKSEEYTVDKTVSNLPNSVIIEKNKRARISTPENRAILPKNANISWNTSLNNLSEAIPLFVTSVPITCSENNNQFSQSTDTLQGNRIELKNSSINGIRLIHNADLQRIDGSCKHPSGITLTSSVQSKANNARSHSLVTNDKNIQIRTCENPTHLPKARKASVVMQPQMVIQNSVQGAAASNTIIYSIGQSNLQNSQGDPLNLPENSSSLIVPQTLPQQVSSRNERVAFTSHGGTQIPGKINRDMTRQNESKQVSESSFPPLNGALHKSIPKNCTNTPTGNNEYQHDQNKVPQTDNLLTQLSDGFPITSVCDGDAGSGPAAEAGFTHQAASGCPVDSTAEPVISKCFYESTTKAEPGAAAHTSIFTNAPATRVPQTSFSTTGKYCDRSRLIPKKVPLQNLKFRILDSSIVQMRVCDTLTVTIHPKTDTLKNSRHRAKSRSPTDKQKSYPSPEKRPESQSLEFVDDNKNDDAGITEECSSVTSNLRYPENLTVSPRKPESPIRDPKNCIISEQRLDIDDDHGTAPTITNDKTKGSCGSEEKCTGEKKISDVHSNEAMSLSSDENYYSAKKNKSLVFSCFKNDEENYFCAQQISKKWYLKSSWKRSDNVVVSDKWKRSSEDSKKSSVKTVKDTSDTRSLSPVDFCNNAFYRLHNKDEIKSSIGINEVSKRLFRDNRNSSEFNPPVNCYGNFKKVVDHSSKLLNYDHCNSDANLQDLLKSNCNNIADVRLDENNEVLGNVSTVKSDKRRDNSRLNNGEDQAGNTNHNPNISHMLSCKSMNRIIARDTCVEIKKPDVVALKDVISSNKGEKVIDHKFSIHEQLNIKVRIDLKKIQSFIDNKPLLFKKRDWAKSNQDEDAIASLSNPYSSHPRVSSFDCTTKIVECVDDTTDKQVKKKIKYDPHLFEKNAES